jgi:cytidyltransferase-like protein
MGTFDGVHRGHAALIAETRRLAERLRAEIPDVRAGA